MIKAIFAVDANNGMGKDGSLPWPKNSEDLKLFKKYTYGNTVVMGGKTWRDPFMPKPLPGRTNIVVTSESIDIPEVITVSDNWKEFVVDYSKDKEVYIIGGASLLEQSVDIIDEVILTKFTKSYGCDVKIDLNEFLKDFHNPTNFTVDYGVISFWKKNI